MGEVMTAADLRATMTRLFGPLHENTHSYYSEIAGDVLWTEKFTSPGGHPYMLAINICEADEPEGDPTCFIVEFWWLPPMMKGTMMGHEIPRFDPEGIGVYTTEDEAENMKVLLDTVMVPKIDEDHLRMLAIYYWRTVLQPTYKASGVPADGLGMMQRKYVEGAVANPEAMCQIQEWYRTEVQAKAPPA